MAHILIVDDSATERHYLKTFLAKNGYDITEARSGEEGIRTARNVKPDLILMDVVMPGMNGFQATRQLSKTAETSTIPVVIVTTKNQQADKVWATRQGAKGFISKPVDTDDLLHSIRSFLSS